MRTKAIILLTLCWAGLASTARAAISFQYVTDATSYTTQQGGTVTVNLYLQEKDTAGSTSLIASENGLFGAGIYITRSGTAPASPTLIASIAPNTNTNPISNGFNGPVSYTHTMPASSNIAKDPTQIGMGEAVDTGSGANKVGPSGSTPGGSITSANGVTTTRVFLGTLTLTGGGTGTTTFTVASSGADPVSNGTTGLTVSSTNFYDLDATNNATNGGGATYTGAFDPNTPVYTFTVVSASVPEPGSLALGFLAAGGMGLGAWRRWRNRHKTQA